jgi:hypothetical protein
MTLLGVPNNGDNPITLTFTRFELKRLSNSLGEALDVLTRDPAHLRDRATRELEEAVATFRAVIARAMP